jgi:hypothetical protein
LVSDPALTISYMLVCPFQMGGFFCVIHENCRCRLASRHYPLPLSVANWLLP